MIEDVNTRPRTNADSGTHAIARDLKARILAGEYALGQQLVEMELAAEFCVGRGRMREAFRTLVGEGYLEFIANRGVFVRHYSREEMLATGRAREVLEGLAARIAAEQTLGDAQRQALEQAQVSLNSAESAIDIDRFSIENHAYHRLIVGLADNALVSEFFERVRLPLGRLQLPESFATDSLARSNRDHRTITMAILSNAPDAAEAAMRAHVRSGNEHIASLPDAVFI